jgi:hypothetical protein
MASGNVLEWRVNLFHRSPKLSFVFYVEVLWLGTPG